MSHVLGFVGTTLDRGLADRRWNRWRPTVGLCQQDHFKVSRLDLLYQRSYLDLATAVAIDCRQVSPGTEVRLFELQIPDPWDFQSVYAELEDFALAHQMPEDGLVHITTGSHVSQICMFLLSEARILPSRLVQTFPNRADKDDIRGQLAVIDLDLSRYDRLAARSKARADAAQSLLLGGAMTRNSGFARLISDVEQVAATRAPILLSGPTGAGKTWLARRIDALKRERQQVKGAFVEVNCAVLRGGTAMSALFGHIRGAFTGAQNDRPGFLKSADKGVLFLDEVGELGTDEQAQLLRAIEEKRFFPVGSDREVQSDFQLVCGTNRDLYAEVAAGRFREDLLARLDVWHFVLPGLRDRREDIGELLISELVGRGRELGRRVTISREALADYVRFAESPQATWVGNLRDLGASAQRMATLAPGGRVGVEVVASELERLKHRWQRNTSGDVLMGVLSEEQLLELDRFDRVQLEEVIRVCRASKSLSEAGRVLFAASRQKKASSNDADRLKKYLARFGLEYHLICAQS